MAKRPLILALALASLGGCEQRRPDAASAPQATASSVPAASELAEEVLYDFGKAPPANVYHLHVDGDSLYFAQKTNRLMRAPKAGGSKPEVFARFEHAVEGGPIRTDATYVYYADGHFVKRKPKAGGDTRAYDVGDGNNQGNFVVDGDNIYQAGINCSPFLRINKESGEQTKLAVPKVVDGGGGVELRVVSSTVYCITVGSNGGALYALDSGASALRSVRKGSIIWGVTTAPDALIFTTGANGIDRMQFHSLDDRSQQITALSTAVSPGAGELELDAKRGSIFVSYSTNLGKVGRLDLANRQFASMVPAGRFMRDAFAADADYVYWAQQGVAQPEQIRRIHKDARSTPDL